MWHTFLELLLYSSLGASLLTYTDITPDALFLAETTPKIATHGEQIETTLSIKTNTPIIRIDGSVQHGGKELSPEDIYHHPQYRFTTKSQNEQETIFSLESAGETPVGVLPLMTITQNALEHGTSTITFTNLSAKTTHDESTFLTTQLTSEVFVTDEKIPQRGSFIDALFSFFTQN